MEQWIVTIDGPAGVGKSTVARMLADKLDAVFLDTGATYRAVTVAAVQRGVDLTDVQAVLKVMDQTDFRFFHEKDLLKVLINGQDATQKIRDPEITEEVKYVACRGELRSRLVKLQQDFAAQFDRVVTEGRDQGTVAFPNAKFKFYLTADPAERARRRHKELAENGKTVDFDQLLEQINVRDASDVNREVGPLRPAEDAIHIDTTAANAQGVVNTMFEIIKGRHG